MADRTRTNRQSEGASPVLCPSARCEDGAYLIGVVGADGVVGYVSPLLQVDAKFVAASRSKRGPEHRFRFAQPCVEAGCSNWDGSRCEVIDRALGAVREAELDLGDRLPRCHIRRWCRWFDQVGPDACRTCPLVITDSPRPKGNVRVQPTSTQLRSKRDARAARPGFQM